MVDVNTQNKTISVNVSSSGVSSNVSASGDASQYYSEKAKEWAISNRIVDGVDYSSKYYAGSANQSALNAQSFAQSAQDSYNNFQQSVDGALSNIDSSVQSGIDEINNTKTDIITDIEFVADGEKQEIEELIDSGKDEIQELTNEIKDNAEDIINRVSLSMFDTILKDHVLSYEETKGLALQGTYVYKEALAGSRYGYPDFYAKCLEEQNSATATEVTLGDSTITMYVASNGHQYYDIANKDVVDTFFGTMGTAWFYGVDTENERIFLPRNNYFEQATGDVLEVGKSVEAGLPNITGSVGINKTDANPQWSPESGVGALNKRASTGTTTAGGTTQINGVVVTFDASLSNPIYSNSDTVQPNAVKKLLYICVGNTVSDTSWVDAVTQVENGVKDLEDKKNNCIDEIEAVANSYDNLTYRQITNCILEKPQRVKVELNNGVLTLKAGSVVTIPNGVGVFEYYTIPEDVSLGADVVGPFSTGPYAVSYSKERNTFELGNYYYTQVTSGPTFTGTQYCLWYDTANNIFKYTDNTGSTFRTGGISFPVCNVAIVNNVGFTDLLQTFNSIGYIGSSVWVDKDLKVLIPDGRNEDGSINNIEYKTTSLSTSLIDANWEEHTWLLDSDGTFGWYPMAGGEVHYNPETNYWEDSRYPQKKYVSIGFSKCNNDVGIITSFIPNQAFKAYNYNNNSDNPHIIKTYKRDQAWYDIYSNGKCKQGGVTSCSNTGTMKRTTTLLIPYIDTKYSVFTQGLNAQNVSDNVFISARLTNAFETYTTNISPAGAYTNDYLWEAEGYIDLSAVL